VEIEGESKFDENFGPLCKPCYKHTVEADGREVPEEEEKIIAEEPLQDDNFIERFESQTKETPIYLDEDYPLKEEPVVEEYVPDFVFNEPEPIITEPFNPFEDTDVVALTVSKDQPQYQYYPYQDQSMGRAVNRILDFFEAIPRFFKGIFTSKKPVNPNAPPKKSLLDSLTAIVILIFTKKKKTPKVKPVVDPNAPVVVKLSLFERINIFRIWYGNKKIKLETGLSPRQRIKRYNASMEERENADTARKTKRQC
jgi:hypothetical protein